ncbi:MAG TPA: MFS transporter [Caulobacteraceae bacterium]|nr:MFS transporter [Caulobacteraceae bacterium]
MFNIKNAERRRAIELLETPSLTDAKLSVRQRLPLSILLPFATTNIPLAALGVSVFVYLAPYLASHLGVSLTAVGAGWFIVRMLDLGVDFGLGVVMDRTRTRLGRYRLWMLIGVPILMLGLYQLFMAPKGIDMVYLVGWLFVFYVGWSIMTLSQSAWGATLAPHYDERSRLFGVLAGVGALSASAVLISPIIAKSLGFTDAQGVQGMGWFSIILAPITVALAAWRTPETITTDHAHKPFNVSDYLAVLAKPDLLRMALAQVSLTLGPGWMSALYLFYFQQARGYSQQEASILLLLYILAGVAGAPTTAWVASRLSKHRTLMVTTTAYSLGLCTVAFIPKGVFIAAVPVMLWCGAMASGFDLMVRAMLADVGDEVRLEQGKERISLIYAVNGLAAKIAAACALLFTYPLIQVLGFNPKEGVVNTPGAIQSLQLAYIIGPIVFVMLGGACVFGWRLDAKKHADIRAQLEARDALYTEAPIIESVTATPAAAIVTEG